MPDKALLIGDNESTVAQPPGPERSTPSQPDQSSEDVSRQLLAAVNQLSHLLDELPRLLRAAPPVMSAIRASREAGNRYLVYVHGICRHDPGYSDPWWDALSPYVPSLQPGDLGGTRREVLWSDLIGGTRALARTNDAAAELARRLRDTLADRNTCRSLTPAFLAASSTHSPTANASATASRHALVFAPPAMMSPGVSAKANGARRSSSRPTMQGLGIDGQLLNERSGNLLQLGIQLGALRP